MAASVNAASSAVPPIVSQRICRCIVGYYIAVAKAITLRPGTLGGDAGLGSFAGGVSPMFEFHGWIRIWAGDPDETTYVDANAALAAIRVRVQEAQAAIGCWFEVGDGYNGQFVLVAHGLRNHPQ